MRSISQCTPSPFLEARHVSPITQGYSGYIYIPITITISITHLTYNDVCIYKKLRPPGFSGFRTIKAKTGGRRKGPLDWPLR